MNEIKLFDVSMKNTILTRLWDVLDTYEIRDTETSINQVRRDLQERPLDIIDYLLTIIENM